MIIFSQALCHYYEAFSHGYCENISLFHIVSKLHHWNGVPVTLSNPDLDRDNRGSESNPDNNSLSVNYRTVVI